MGNGSACLSDKCLPGSTAPPAPAPAPAPYSLFPTQQPGWPVTAKVGCVTLPVSTVQAQVSLAVRAVSLQWPTGLTISRQPLLCSSGPTVLPRGLCTFALSACSAPLLVFYGEVPTLPPPGSCSNAASAGRPSWTRCRPALVFTSPPHTSFLSVSFIIIWHTMAVCVYLSVSLSLNVSSSRERVFVCFVCC